MIQPGPFGGVAGLVSGAEIAHNVLTVSRERDNVIHNPPPPILRGWTDCPAVRTPAVRHLALPAITLQDVGGGPFLTVGALLKCSSPLLGVSLDLPHSIGISSVPAFHCLFGTLPVSRSPPATDLRLTVAIRLLPDSGSLDRGFAVGEISRVVIVSHAGLTGSDHPILRPPT